MIQRTTIAAEADDLATLREEARRQGVSFAQLVAGVLAQKAIELRRARRPRIGVVRAGGGAAAASVDDEESPAATPPRG